MNIEIGTIRSSPFIGVFAMVTEKIALLPKIIEPKEKNLAEKLFDTEIIHAKLADCNLLGVLAVGNSNGLVVSEIAEEREINELEQLGLRIKKVPGITAIGNLVECNDKIALCSHAIGGNAREIIEETLKVKTIEMQIASSDLTGSNIVLTNNGFIVNPLVSETEFEKIEKETGLKGTTATTNFGDKFVGNGVIANSRSALIGIHTTGHELMRIDEGLSGR